MAPDTRGARTWIALGSFTLGGFGIGSTEFSAMGLLPNIAAEHTPKLFASAPDVATAGVSIFTWGYALGVVVGALVLGPLSPRFRERPFVVWSLVAMAGLTALTAAAPLLAGVAALRIASAIPHATYIGVAAIVCARLLGGRSEGRGVAVVLGGLTLASVLGAPVATRLGGAIGWRWVYIAIAVIYVVAAVGLMFSLPRHLPRIPVGGSASAAVAVPGSHTARAAANVHLWLTILVFGLVNAGIFAVMTFIGPMWIAAGGAMATVALAVAVSGVGMTIGNYLGGSLMDRSPRSAALLLGATILGGLGIIIVLPFAQSAVTVGFGLVGMALGSGGPYIQVRLMLATPDRPQFGSSMNSLSANFGSVIGSIAASVAVAAFADVRAAALAGLALSASGGVGLLVMRRTSRQAGLSGRRPLSPPSR